MKAHNKTIAEWFEAIDAGKIALPRFQRGEVWKDKQILGVLQNILRKPSLPIGALLVLELAEEEEERLSSRAIGGGPAPDNPIMSLLDGQQRMTAIWRSLSDTHQGRSALVSLNDSKYPRLYMVRNSDNYGNKDQPWFDLPAEYLDKENKFPISILRPGEEGQRAMELWLYDANAEQRVREVVEELRGRLHNYTIPLLSLPAGTDLGTVLDVFININTSATNLKPFDIVVALVEGAANRSLRDMVRDLKRDVPDIKHYGKTEEMVLAIAALLQGKAPNKATYLNKEFGRGLPKVWDKVKMGLQEALPFLQQEGFLTDKLLPLEPVIHLAAALFTHVPQEEGDEAERARTLIRKAIWCASFTDRYMASWERDLFWDYVAISDMIKHRGAKMPPPLFHKRQSPLPTARDLYWSKWPKTKSRLGRAILATSLRRRGLDLTDGKPVNSTNVKYREYHHLFPPELFGSRGFMEYYGQSALNCILISYSEKRRIAPQSPWEYLRDVTRHPLADLEDDFIDRLESHLVPYKELRAGNFMAFLKARAALIQNDMLQLCEGEEPE